jgi:hypothetical protein
MERTRSILPLAAGTAALLSLGASAAEGQGSWLAGRASGFVDLIVAAATSPWAWLCLLVVFSSGAVTVRRTLGGVVAVAVSAALVFLLGPTTSALPWTGVTIESALTASPAANAATALNGLAARFGDLTQATSTLGLLVGVPCLLLITAHLRGVRYAATVARGETRGPLQLVLERPVGLTTTALRVLWASVAAILLTTVVVWIGAGAVWVALAGDRVVRVTGDVGFASISDPGRAALVGGWYPKALWAVPVLGLAGAMYLGGRARVVLDRQWHEILRPATLLYWAFLFFGGVTALFVPAGVLLFLTGFTFAALAATPFGQWPLPDRPVPARTPIRRVPAGRAPRQPAKVPRGRRARARYEEEERRKRDEQWRAELLLRALLAAGREAAPEPPPGAERPRPGPGPAPRKPTPTPAGPQAGRHGVATLPVAPLLGSTLVAHPRPICAGSWLGDGTTALLEADGSLTIYAGGDLLRRLSVGAGQGSRLLPVPGRSEIHVVAIDALTVVQPQTGVTRVIDLPPGGPVHACSVSPQGVCVLARPVTGLDGGSQLLAVFSGPGTADELLPTPSPLRAPRLQRRRPVRRRLRRSRRADDPGPVHA